MAEEEEAEEGPEAPRISKNKNRLEELKRQFDAKFGTGEFDRVKFSIFWLDEKVGEVEEEPETQIHMTELEQVLPKVISKQETILWGYREELLKLVRKDDKNQNDLDMIGFLKEQVQKQEV